MKLLQAPTGAKADWANLKGKVVVLEFWATWCSPCVASLPHISRLVASLDSAKFQFISIDDESQKAIEAFLARKKMSGWVGVDASGRVFASYGVAVRPTTVIVDGNGKIVAVTDIDSVSEADLRAVAAGKHVAFKPAMEIANTSVSASPVSASHILFAVSVSQASPDARFSQINHSPTGVDYVGYDADGLMTSVFNVFENRYVLKGSLPDGRYNLRTNFVGVPRTVTDQAVQRAVLTALHLQIQQRTLTRRAYILRATPASKKLLSPSGSTRGVKRGAWHGMFILMNGTMDDLAYVLATGLENPVINETGIHGVYDARFRVAEEDLNDVNAVLKKTMGLELVPGNREMSITVAEVSTQQDTSSRSTTTQADKR